MKILFITPSFYPNIGGVEKSVEMVAAELSDRGNIVTIITEKSNGNYLSFEKSTRYSIYRIPKSLIKKTNLLWKWIWFLFHINLLIKSKIIHFHDFGTLIYWYLPFRFILFFKKYYITFHGYEGYPIRERDKILRTFCEKLTKGNICVGDYISRWYNTKPDYVYHAAVKCNSGDYNVTNPKNILFLGRLEKDTGILAYIESLKLFYKNKKHKCIFQICGDGSLKDKILDILKENNIPFKFLGKKKNVITYIQNAKIVLASSYLSIIESLSYGKMVIAYYDNPVKRSYLLSFPENEKLFFCVENISDINNLLVEIIDYPEKHKSKTDYGRVYAKNHSWTKVADIYLKLYRADEC